MRTDLSRASISGLDRRTLLRRAISAFALSGAAITTLRRAHAETRIASLIAEVPEANPLLQALQFAANALKSLETVKDYEAVLIRQELVGKKLMSSKLSMKLRQEPFSVYLKYLEPSAGREVIFNKGKNDDKLQAHETGFASIVGTLSLDPAGKMAMDGNRYPITMIGLKTLTETVIDQWLTISKSKTAKVNFYPNAKVGDVSCETMESVLESAVSGVETQKIRLYVDAATKLPIRAQSFGFPVKTGDKSPLIEDYLYSALKTNVGLKDADFDVENAAYNF